MTGMTGQSSAIRELPTASPCAASFLVIHLDALTVMPMALLLTIPQPPIATIVAANQPG